jgi:Activator of mitotic machinery Cdc14 phosphatase activation C-term
MKSHTQDRSQYQRHGPGGWSDQGNALAGPPVLNFYYNRFPIHVERAIYRLSHIKLANPRRPLLQQVLLSNFMYGYLNLINKAAQPQTQVQEVQQQAPQETYEEQSQQEDHVFYSSEEPDYYGQDYYGAEYEDEPDEVSSSVTFLTIVRSSRS